MVIITPLCQVPADVYVSLFPLLIHSGFEALIDCEVVGHISIPPSAHATCRVLAATRCIDTVALQLLLDLLWALALRNQILTCTLLPLSEG